MTDRGWRRVLGLGVLASLLWAGLARADAPAPPVRPPAWDQGPPPLPEPPPEKELPVALLALALGLAAGEVGRRLLGGTPQPAGPGTRP